MLKGTVQIYEGSDIPKYKQLIVFLKKQNERYEPKKSKVLTFEQIIKFLNDVWNESYLFIQVALIFALNETMRGEELRSLTLNDIEENEAVIVVTLRNTKRKKKRVFTITWKVTALSCRKLRPQNIGHSRFFVYYRNGKCTVLPVGINTFYSLPGKIAEYLKLPDSSSYTSHCMRRSLATMLVDNGSTIPNLKRLGGWTSTSSAEGYIGESIQNKIQTSKKIFRRSNQQEVSKNCPWQHSSSPSSSIMDVSLNEFSKSTLNGILFQNISNCTFSFYGNEIV
ncbi:Phage integrase domain containing protein [Asbolus verrucosus]|uniref:Phage integrase domain containing protein n=1 Tax=Asbolus verrucosus TaxID=1661398 RepID=A0A482VHE2_ASBVE|nr:Phage integrase domain containing protein [Asbolus verrucosus]